MDLAPPMAGLYERILALVPVDDLHDSYNGVLHDKISPITRAVNDVSAAFAKLEEVNRAVNKLNNVPTITRSVTLAKTMDTTLQLQQQLCKKLESTIAAMTKSCGKRKRAENNGNGCEPKAAKNDIKCEELRASKHEGAKINREEVQPESHEQSSGGDTVKRSSWASELTNANCLGKLRKLTQLSVVMRSKHLSEVLAKVTELVPTSKETEQIPILKYVLLWANLSAGTPADVTVYDWFSEKMTAVIDQGPRTEVAAGLRRLNDSLLALLRDQKECRDCQRTTISENRLRLDLLVWRVNAMAASERNNHFRQVVDAFKHAMCGDPDKKATRFLNKTLKTVRKWPIHLKLRGLYGELAEHIQSYADSVGDFIVKSELDSEMKKFKIKDVAKVFKHKQINF
ncbi:hypothetical protein GN958_ATG07428 [Phytophthora infestans]|uniref:Uncharacterized protein n=1 Tax=Phytophthora infestans TaxID=4787 RepID=A0A8S9UVR6_PHYIN|nr:hypothetical protein GN958_ATG07428 [Phytophthora infestans]